MRKLMLFAALLSGCGPMINGTYHGETQVYGTCGFDTVDDLVVSANPGAHGVFDVKIVSDQTLCASYEGKVKDSLAISVTATKPCKGVNNAGAGLTDFLSGEAEIYQTGPDSVMVKLPFTRHYTNRYGDINSCTYEYSGELFK